MRSYRQYSALARALDVIGDRWTMLIVRELALRECRYSDLRDGLGGIATNLLADRLRELEAAGLVERRDAPPPVAATLYRLTDRERGLVPALGELVRWGEQLMLDGPAATDGYRNRWLAFASGPLLDGVATDPGEELTVVVEAEDEPVSVHIDESGPSATLGAAGDPDVVLSGNPAQALAVIAGQLPLGDTDLRITCTRAAGRRLQRLATAAREQREARQAVVAR